MEERSIIQNDEIDLVQLVKTIWAGRKIIFSSIAICFCLGIIIAFTSPVKYKASAILLPSSEKKGGSLGGLSSLAGLAGINLGGLTDASGIEPSLYPQIVESTPFKKELTLQKFDFIGFSESKSFIEISSIEKSESFVSLVQRYTIRLPFTIKDAFTSKSEVPVSKKKFAVAIETMSASERSAIGLVSNIVKLTVDSKAGLVNVEVELGEALLAAQVATRVVEMLQRYVIDYKTQQVRQKLLFVEQNYTEKKDDFERAQKALLNYRDQNRNVLSERINIDYQRLSDRYDLSSTVYRGVAQQYEQVKLQLKEETPVFTILEPVQIPTEKSAPKKSIIITISIFLGILLGITSAPIILFVPALKKRFSKFLILS